MIIVFEEKGEQKPGFGLAATVSSAYTYTANIAANHLITQSVKIRCPFDQLAFRSVCFM